MAPWRRGTVPPLGRRQSACLLSKEMKVYTICHGYVRCCQVKVFALVDYFPWEKRAPTK